MSLSTVRKLPVTAAEYLEGGEMSAVRHEYVNGRVFAMSGASHKPNEISFGAAEAADAESPLDGAAQSYLRAAGRVRFASLNLENPFGRNPRVHSVSR